MAARPRRIRSFRWQLRRAPLWVVVLALVLVLLRWWQDAHRPQTPGALAEGTYRVQRVVDGDTLLLENNAYIRLIGADTPETKRPNHPVEPFGPEAAEMTERFVAENGYEVRLEFDRQRLDRYGRFLAYVWLGDRLLNEELIRQGLATAETGYSYAADMKRRFRRAEQQAQAARRGIWSMRQPAAEPGAGGTGW